ncbi:septum formation family protein [Polymorphospora rubra]|uniref:Septum formation-related domain-containing protein n=1 Tax=Polymorphospora rubra TaxID=338584 RepID=A0A810N7Y5_9ACTN|nr:septum formation family protein [Polymorphospora rubra]BCJ67898.1 hypothetical protein Prubr_49190 [Polymorphospora rubra]
MRHRRFDRLLAALAAGLALTVTGCGSPAEVDGLLTDDWPALAEPALFTPAAGVCHRHAPRFDTGAADYKPVDCGTIHQTETFHVDAFDAGQVEPPKLGDPTLKAAYDTCDTKAREWLGGRWQDARLSLRVGVPTRRAWDAGARWFRCDIQEFVALHAREAADREKSLRGELAGESDLRLGCFDYEVGDEYIEKMLPTLCGIPHLSEYVGTHTATHRTYEAMEADVDGLHRACRRVLAGYAKVPEDARLADRAGWFYYQPDPYEWGLGDRAVRCFVDRYGSQLTRSVRDGGDAALPVRY